MICNKDEDDYDDAIRTHLKSGHDYVTGLLSTLPFMAIKKLFYDILALIRPKQNKHLQC